MVLGVSLIGIWSTRDFNPENTQTHRVWRLRRQLHSYHTGSKCSTGTRSCKSKLPVPPVSKVLQPRLATKNVNRKVARIYHSPAITYFPPRIKRKRKRRLQAQKLSYRIKSIVRKQREFRGARMSRTHRFPHDSDD